MAEIKIWASILDESTRRQAEMLSRAPGVIGHVALMPDAHLGRGATVGSVIPTELDTIIPASVGVDIGCGMVAVRTNKVRDQLPNDLSILLHLFKNSIPAGVGGKHESGMSRASGASEWFRNNPIPYSEGLNIELAKMQLGTLGSGNHFVEVCIDQTDRVWVVLHSGSRGIGYSIANIFIKKATIENTYELEDQNLAGLRGSSFELYIEMMQWAQRYACANREFMMEAALSDIQLVVSGLKEEDRINCHHNFAMRECHFGKEVWITRKGAIKAYVGDFGIVPGSMGDHTYITQGLGNQDSYMSSAHGAGRRYSRRAAKRNFSVQSLEKHMEGKVWNIKDAKALLDEHPEAYKPISQVMSDQQDLATVIHTLTQILNYKGT